MQRRRFLKKFGLLFPFLGFTPQLLPREQDETVSVFTQVQLKNKEHLKAIDFASLKKSLQSFQEQGLILSHQRIVINDRIFYHTRFKDEQTSKHWSQIVKNTIGKECLTGSNMSFASWRA